MKGGVAFKEWLGAAIEKAKGEEDDAENYHFYEDVLMKGFIGWVANANEPYEDLEYAAKKILEVVNQERIRWYA